ncbi:MAG: hypothetical protein PSV35_02820 [bacterium]|nr:hypothetical protein [bacterium]
MSKLKIRLILMVVGMIISFYYPVFAATPQNNPTVDTPEQWHFTVAPYGWLSSISANISVKEITNHIFIPIDKIFKNLDFVGELHLEASHGPWSFMLDPTYVKLSTHFSAGPIYVGPLQRTVLGPIDVHVTSQTLLIDGGVFYRVFETQTAPNQSLSFEVFGGGRYLGLKNQVELGSSRSEIFPGISVTGTTNVLAPIIGGRIKQNFSKIHLWLLGNVGGFSLDNVTNTWAATAGLAYNLRPYMDLGFAYRVLKINVTKSTDLGFNALMYGPEIGLAFQFDK